jgi:hypothetical protein
VVYSTARTRGESGANVPEVTAELEDIVGERRGRELNASDRSKANSIADETSRHNQTYISILVKCFTSSVPQVRARSLGANLG